ncbi:hypothetical protein ELE36_09740 [Pseudolysobacter antarcticus]|uniref:Uncharacterized protein n=1 Tax=Pseudolysobacter antarcticus TaxID=2511995 RepID=A0A411HJE5_9GAMM|nr:hypothetical protein [Pseudolysobacter antarcticus]QBB70625.1 hypothetical protein ELE36_09740 [Pseudolysobacter antarcticus]
MIVANLLFAAAMAANPLEIGTSQIHYDFGDCTVISSPVGTGGNTIITCQDNPIVTYTPDAPPFLPSGFYSQFFVTAIVPSTAKTVVFSWCDGYLCGRIDTIFSSGFGD